MLFRLLPVALAAVAAHPAPDLSATTAQRVHPVLIRNEHNEVTEVQVELASDSAVSLTRLTFSMEGTGSLADVALLELRRAGKASGSDPGPAVAPPARPANVVTFPIDPPLILRRGANAFWLTCRLADRADLSRTVAARCTRIETNAGAIEPEDLTPGRRHRIGIALRKAGEGGVHTTRIPALAATPRGTLLCAYDLRRRMGRDLQEDIDIGLSRSADGGKTWEPVRVIMDMGEYNGLPQYLNGCSDPGLVVDAGTGEIFCFAVWMNGKAGKHQWVGDGSEPGFEIGKSAQMLMVRSKDDGRTWSPPENLTRTLKKPEWWLLAPSPQSGFTLPDGTLVMPVQGRDAGPKEFATIMISRDHGRTWTVGEPAFKGGNECQAALLSDGSIMLNMRNDLDRFRAVAVTSDLGTTWKSHPTSRKALIEPNCNASLISFDLKERPILIFSNPHSQKSRTHQTIQISLDDGKTWPASLRTLLDEGRGAGYSSLARVDDGHVGIVYEGSRAHVVFERFPIGELLTPDTNRGGSLHAR